MTEGIDTRMLEPDATQAAFTLFVRGVALFCLAAGVGYWIRLIGYYPGANWRFDLMPLHWQVAAPVLAVLFPFASVGLWMVTSWGPVVWMICASCEIVMFGIYPHYFGDRVGIIGVHGLISIIFIVFFLVTYWRRRQADH